jgi:hypothetical protein
VDGNESTALLARLRELSEVAWEGFSRQHQEIRGSWMREDWQDRIVHHIAFLETHDWDGIHWRPKPV